MIILLSYLFSQENLFSKLSPDSLIILFNKFDPKNRKEYPLRVERRSFFKEEKKEDSDELTEYWKSISSLKLEKIICENKTYYYVSLTEYNLNIFLKLKESYWNPFFFLQEETLTCDLLKKFLLPNYNLVEFDLESVTFSTKITSNEKLSNF